MDNVKIKFVILFMIFKTNFGFLNETERCVTNTDDSVLNQTIYDEILKEIWAYWGSYPLSESQGINIETGKLFYFGRAEEAELPPTTTDPPLKYVYTEYVLSNNKMGMRFNDNTEADIFYYQILTYNGRLFIAYFCDEMELHRRFQALIIFVKNGTQDQIRRHEIVNPLYYKNLNYWSLNLNGSSKIKSPRLMVATICFLLAFILTEKV